MLKQLNVSQCLDMFPDVLVETLEFRDSTNVLFQCLRKQTRFGCFDKNEMKFCSLYVICPSVLEME